jgi:hypothetical protein
MKKQYGVRELAFIVAERHTRGIDPDNTLALVAHGDIQYSPNFDVWVDGGQFKRVSGEAEENFARMPMDVAHIAKLKIFEALGLNVRRRESITVPAWIIALVALGWLAGEFSWTALAICGFHIEI